MRYVNWNPTTADEPDPNPGLREDEIERVANTLMDDQDWIEDVLYDGIVSRELAEALTDAYVPEKTHARVGGLLMDALWEMAKRQAEKYVDDGGYL